MSAEDRIQASIVDFVRTVAPDCLIFHVPNGGYREKREAARLKWIGVMPGIPDLILLIPGGRVACIEVKTPLTDLTGEQPAIHDRLIRMDVPRMVARSIDDVRAALKQWHVKTREAGDLA